MAPLKLSTFLLALGLTGTRAASAAPPLNPHAYAVVIGTNHGGPGQKPLAYAEHDAQRVARILSEIGGYVPANVKLLVAPDGERTNAALDGLRDSVERAKKSGADPVAFFYYSGHARASSLNVGAEHLALDALRARLLALPTSLTIVVLDACQSGAFSRVKGAAPSADFSFNSVNSLRTRGVAVMASSTASELSQESEQLRGSYFTHHLLVGLRGAGDADRDGRVSLDEAYRYAYAGTLTGTARTRVGMQHVTLETDLRGRGDVPVSYPAHAGAHIDFPSGFAGNVLLTRRQGGGIVAELTKTPGAPLRLAVPAGGYQAIVRRQDTAWECDLTVAGTGSTALALDGCRQLPDDEAQAKGRGVVQRGETWSFEAAVGFAGHGDDDYTQRLEDFGFGEGLALVEMPETTWALGVTRRVYRRLSLVARVRQLEALERQRSNAGSDDSDRFELDAYGLGVGARGILETRNEVVGGYAQLSVGPAFAKTALTEGSTGERTSESHFGAFADLTLGFRVMPFRPVGLFVEWSGSYAPVAKNLLDERRNSGGAALLFGIRGRTWGEF